MARLALVCSLAGVPLGPVAQADTPIAAHSMLYVDSPLSFKQTMFEEASRMHASMIRVDVALAIIFRRGLTDPDWQGLDQYTQLSARYHLPVLANVATVPWQLADCRSPASVADMGRCGTDQPAEYATLVQMIVTHAHGAITHWELWNEPDNPASFSGTPQEYAGMMMAAATAVHSAQPNGQVVLGGISDLAGMHWMSQVLAAPGMRIQAADIANIHLRGALGGITPAVTEWKRYFHDRGFDGPLWVTEHGYPSDPSAQYDPQFNYGLLAQADYLSRSLPAIVAAGASKVFVTERDNLSGPFASEGLLSGNVSDPPRADVHAVEKPALGRVAALALSLHGPSLTYASSSLQPFRHPVIDAAPRSRCVELPDGATYLCPPLG